MLPDNGYDLELLTSLQVFEIYKTSNISSLTSKKVFCSGSTENVNKNPSYQMLP